jgi:hypothetical protein
MDLLLIAALGGMTWTQSPKQGVVPDCGRT